MSRKAEPDVLDLTASQEGSYSRREPQQSLQPEQKMTAEDKDEAGQTAPQPQQSSVVGGSDTEEKTKKKKKKNKKKKKSKKKSAAGTLVQRSISDFLAAKPQEAHENESDASNEDAGAVAGPGPRTLLARQAVQQDAARETGGQGALVATPSPAVPIAQIALAVSDSTDAQAGPGPRQAVESATEAETHDRTPLVAQASAPAATASSSAQRAASTIPSSLTPRTEHLNVDSRPDYRNDPQGKELAQLDNELLASYDSVFEEGGFLESISFDAKKLRAKLQEGLPTAASFFLEPGWTLAEESVFLPGFLKLMTRKVAIQHFLVTSKTWEDKAAIWILRLHSIPLRKLVLLLAEPYRRSIGLQSYALALDHGEDPDASDYLPSLDKRDKRGMIYLKIVEPSQILGGNPLLRTGREVGSYTGITAMYQKRQYQYDGELRNYVEQEEQLREQGIGQSEMLDLMDPRPRLFARFALGDVSVPRDPSLELSAEVSVSSYVEIMVPRLWWRRQELQETIETLGGLLSHSYGITAHRFDAWRYEMSTLDFALPFSLADFDHMGVQIPLMRQLPVASDSVRSMASRKIACFVAIQDLLGDGLNLYINVNPDYTNCYLANVPSMDAISAPQSRKVTFRGPLGLHRWTLRVRLDASLALKLNLVPPIGVVVKQADLDALESKMIYTEWPAAVLRRLIHHILTSKTLRKSLKMMPDDVVGLFEVVKDSITNEGLEAINKTLELPDEPSAFNAEIKRRRAIAAVGEDAFSATISKNKNGQSFLLVHNVEQLNEGTRKFGLSRQPGLALYDAAQRSSPNPDRPPPVDVRATDPYSVFDSNGQLLRRKLCEALTGGVSGAGPNTGWSKWLNFLRMLKEGKTKEDEAALAAERAYKAQKVKEAQQRKKEAR